jgi:hypothetical protein
LNEAQPSGRALWAPEQEDPTTRVWKGLMKRPANTSSDVESQERIRCEIMGALEAAIAQTARTTPPPVILEPLKPSPRQRRLNPFLQPRLASDPPPPWAALSAAHVALLGKPPRARAARSARAPEVVAPPRRRQTSMLPLITLVMGIGIGLGFCADRGARVELEESAKMVQAYATKAYATKSLR